MADSILQVADAVRSLGGGGDPAGLSTALVHVRSDGAVEVVIHALVPAGPDQLADLGGLGVEVVDASVVPGVGGEGPSGLVQAWVPAERLEAVAGLPWVAAVTPPAYPPTGG